MDPLDKERLQVMKFEEAEAYIARFKDSHVPPWRRNLLLGFNVAFGAGCFYFTRNFKKYAPNVPAPNRTVWEIVKRATRISICVLALYTAGFYLTLGLKNPLRFFLDYSSMQSQLLGRSLKYSPKVQSWVLFDLMRQFGLSESLIEQAKAQLDRDRTRMIEAGILSARELEEEEGKGEQPAESDKDKGELWVRGVRIK